MYLKRKGKWYYKDNENGNWYKFLFGANKQIKAKQCSVMQSIQLEILMRIKTGDGAFFTLILISIIFLWLCLAIPHWGNV